MTLPRIASVPGGASLAVRLQPRSSRSGVRGLRDGALLLAVNSPPVEGRANEEACRLLARALRIPRSRIRLAAGAKSRNKVFHVSSMGPEELGRRVREAAKSP